MKKAREVKNWGPMLLSDEEDPAIKKSTGTMPEAEARLTNSLKRMKLTDEEIEIFKNKK